MRFCPFSISRCAPDPASPTTCTLAVSIAACDISDSYECFVLQILGDLLIDGANAPFYKSLLESGLGTSFAPATGEIVFFICGKAQRPWKINFVLLLAIVTKSSVTPSRVLASSLCQTIKTLPNPAADLFSRVCSCFFPECEFSVL